MSTFMRTFEERKAEIALDRIVVPELFKMANEYVQNHCAKEGNHPYDVALNAFSFLEFYIQSRD